jgi:Conserved hypothetical protein 2217 (DUF2460)
MSDVIYPALVKSLTFTSLKTSEFPSIVRKAPDGTELRIPQRKNPVWHFTFVYDYLRGNYPSPNSTMAYAPYTDLDALMGFFLSRRGQNDDFLFLGPTDHAAAGFASPAGPRRLLRGSPAIPRARRQRSGATRRRYWLRAAVASDLHRRLYGRPVRGSGHGHDGGRRLRSSIR